MALLIFPPDNLAPQLAELLDPALRKQVATMVNEAILHSQGARREAKIRGLVRMRAWSEGKAREGGMDLPRRLGVGLDEEVEVEMQQQQQGRNGHDGGEEEDGEDGEEAMVT